MDTACGAAALRTAQQMQGQGELCSGLCGDRPWPPGKGVYLDEVLMSCDPGRGGDEEMTAVLKSPAEDQGKESVPNKTLLHPLS